MTATRIAKASTLVALAAALARRRVAPLADERAGRPARPARRRAPVFPAGVLHRSAHYDGARCAGSGSRATLATLAALALFVHLGPRLARADGSSGRVGDRRDGRRGHALGVWVSRRCRSARPSSGGAAATGSSGTATPSGRSSRGRRCSPEVRRVDDRAHRPAAARRALRPALVARRRTAVRRRRRAARLRSAVARAARHPPAARHARRRPHPSARQGRGSRRHAGPDRGCARPDDGGERVWRPGSAPRRASCSGTRCSTGASRTGEIRVVAAHELGHVERRHLWKGLAWSPLARRAAASGSWSWRRAAAAASRARRSCRSRCSCWRCSACSITPLGNVVSRRYEAEADWSALRATHDPAAARERLPQVRSDEPGAAEPAALGRTSGSTTHPTIVQRIAMAERLRGQALRARRRVASRGGSGSPLGVDHFDHESCIASSSSRMNRVDMFTRATTTPGTSPSSTSWSMRANVSVNS